MDELIEGRTLLEQDGDLLAIGGAGRATWHGYRH
jgi:hypothetical protein